MSQTKNASDSSIVERAVSVDYKRWPDSSSTNLRESLRRERKRSLSLPKLDSEVVSAQSNMPGVNAMDISSELNRNDSQTSITSRTPPDDSSCPLKPSSSGLQRDTSYKAAKRNYRMQTKEIIRESKKKFTNRLSGGGPVQAAADNVVLSGNLKFRDAFKAWHARYYELAPGVLHYYKQRRRRGVSGTAGAIDGARRREEWYGTINLASCKIMYRPSKKEGYCFKIFQPQGKNIFGAKGVVESLPIATDYIILRSTDASEGQLWFNAIQKMITSNEDHSANQNVAPVKDTVTRDESDSSDEGLTSESEFEDEIDKTLYCPVSASAVALQRGGAIGELEDENRSIIWSLLKQVKVGMDLSRVTLPTFILEPRSFLELLADYFYHSNVLQIAARTNDSPVQRLIEVVRWYMSGFYKQSKEVKKPYNPILGEQYRCIFRNNDGSRTTFIAEQVSHYPPISAWVVANRKHGWVLNGTVKPISKFSGNSASSVLVGSMKLYLAELNEVYTITLPSAIVKGIFFGTLMVELGGTVRVENMNNGLVAEIEFKQKPMIGGQYNAVAGGIKHGGKLLYTIDGLWDDQINITDARSHTSAVLWAAMESTVLQRLVKYDVAKSDLSDKDSHKLWEAVTTAIVNKDQVAATVEKNKLEDAQRAAHKLRLEKNETYVPKLFHCVIATERGDGVSDEAYYIYKYFNLNKWNPTAEAYDFEKDGMIFTKHRDEQITIAEEVSGVVDRLLHTNSRPKDEIDPDELLKNGGVRGLRHSTTDSALKRSRSVEMSIKASMGHKKKSSKKIPHNLDHGTKNCENMLLALQEDVRQIKANQRWYNVWIAWVVVLATIVQILVSLYR
eukprot:CFRG5346T1